MLSFLIDWHCWLKKSLKILSFSKLVGNFPLTDNGENNGAFSPLIKVLSTDQWLLMG